MAVLPVPRALVNMRAPAKEQLQPPGAFICLRNEPIGNNGMECLRD
jgi:hypothetical protein